MRIHAVDFWRSLSNFIKVFSRFFDIWLDRNKHDFMTRVKEGQNLVFAFFFILFALD